MIKELFGRNLPRVKEINQFLIRETIYRKGPVSRIEIAETLGLTLPTITTNINKMLASGLIHEVEDTVSKNRLGRHTMLVDFVPGSRLYIGLEIRRGFRRVAVVDLRGNLVACAEDSSRLNDYDTAIENAAEITKALLSEKGIKIDEIKAVGICAPGLVDSEAGKLISLFGYVWKDKPIVRHFSKLIGFNGDAVVDNNVIARAFGFSLFNHRLLKGEDSFAYMYVSTGIGCPLFSDASEHFGMVVGEGEVGHMVMNPDGPECRCGNHGCLGVYSSESFILENATLAMKEGRAPVLESIAGGRDAELLMETVMEAMEKGDPAVCALLDEAVRYLGLAIANVDNFVKPGCIVIESRYFNYDKYRKLLMDVINRNLYRRSSNDSRFVFLPDDRYSGAKGAAALAIKNDLESEKMSGE